MSKSGDRGPKAIDQSFTEFLRSNHAKRLGQGENPRSPGSSDSSLKAVRNKQPTTSTPRILARENVSSQDKSPQNLESDFVPRAKVVSRTLYDPNMSFPTRRHNAQPILLQNPQSPQGHSVSNNHGSKASLPVTVSSGQPATFQRASTLRHTQNETSPSATQQAPQTASAPRGGILPVSGLNRKVPAQNGSKRPPQHQRNEPLVTAANSQDIAKDDANKHSGDLQMSQTFPIVTSHDQIMIMIKAVYARLLTIETKCQQMVADHKRDCSGVQSTIDLKEDQYKDWLKAHTDLLTEYHNFLLISQHPLASPGERTLASKQSIPQRLLRHGIHEFLEVLRHHLNGPCGSIEFMIVFVYRAYGMMTLLLETVPVFQDTWIEALGDLARYRMQMTDTNHTSIVILETPTSSGNVELEQNVIQVWCSVAVEWYTRASVLTPSVGRLYHHLAILSQGDPLKQLFYYGKSLSVAAPFVGAWKSVVTIFRPVFGEKEWDVGTPKLVQSFFVLHATLFTGRNPSDLKQALTRFNSELRFSESFFEHGYLIALCNIQALTEFFSMNERLMVAGNHTAESNYPMKACFDRALEVFLQTAEVVLNRTDDESEILGYLHCTLMYLLYLVATKDTAEPIISSFPWTPLATLLNRIVLRFEKDVVFALESNVDINFSKTTSAAFRPLPEDFAMHGLPMTESLFSEGYFDVPNIDFHSSTFADVSDRLINTKIMDDVQRPLRVLRLGRRLADGLEHCDSQGSRFWRFDAAQSIFVAD